MPQSILKNFSTYDYLIFTFFFLITILFVYYGKKIKFKSSDDKFLDYIVLGRSLTLPFFVTNLVASWYGGILGVTKIAFESGIYNFITQGVFWYIAYAIFAFFMVDKISNSKALTLPELVRNKFGEKSYRIASILTFFNILPISYIISLGLFFQLVFGISFLYGMIIGVFFIYLYTLFGGGMRAIVLSDFVYCIIMCSGVAILVIYSYYFFGGISYLTAKLPESYSTITSNESVYSVMIWGFIALSTLVDPCFYQTCLSAKSSKIAKKGILISIIIWCIFDLCTTFGGMYARAYMPGENSQYAYLLYGISILPIGLKGLFVSGILATIISTADSFLFIASNTVSYDIFRIKGKNIIFLNHLIFLFVSIICIILGLYFDGNIKETWKTLGSYMAASLLIPVILGDIFTKKISDNTFFISSIASVVGITIWRNIEHKGFYENIDSFYVGLMISLFIIGGSLLIKKFYFRKISAS